MSYSGLRGTPALLLLYMAGAPHAYMVAVVLRLALKMTGTWHAAIATVLSCGGFKFVPTHVLGIVVRDKDEADGPNI